MTHIKSAKPKFRYEANFPDGEKFTIQKSGMDYEFAWRLKDPKDGKTLEKGFSKTKQNAEKAARAYVNLIRPYKSTARNPYVKNKWKDMGKEGQKKYQQRTDDLLSSIEVVTVNKTKI